MKTGNRDKINNENLPFFEKIDLLNGSIEFRYNFKLIQADGNRLESFDYNYLHIKNERSSIITGIIRNKFDSNKIEAIINNYLYNNEIVEFLQLQNYRDYAKSIADNEPSKASLCEGKYINEVVIPFNLTLEDGDYNDLANRIMKLNIPFKVDHLNGNAIAYPSWIDQNDLNILQSDPRVTINTYNLFL